MDLEKLDKMLVHCIALIIFSLISLVFILRDLRGGIIVTVLFTASWWYVTKLEEESSHG